MSSRTTFHRAKVKRIIRETPDAFTFVLEPEVETFPYRAGQYCTFRVNINGTDFYRSYSMSSAPETDAELMTTVKRVDNGIVSNWLLENVAAGGELTMTRAVGNFCLHPTTVPLLGFSGGSGITPILSLAKSALATTERSVRLMCADRDPASAIFEYALDALAEHYPGRLNVTRHFDERRGFLDELAVRSFVGDDVTADCYVCGPRGFMDLIESALPGPGRCYTERFDHVDQMAPSAADTAGHDSTVATLTIVLDGQTSTIASAPGETVLQSAVRAGLDPPFSCEVGECATCMARVSDGRAPMRMNEVLTAEEMDDGYVLTCQAVPETSSVTVCYD